MENQLQKVAAIVTALEGRFGVPKRTAAMDPLSNLMLTILSQNTNDKNRDQAYRRLRDRFPTWEEVMAGDLAAIEEAIRPGGLARQKSERMQNILRWIGERYGQLNLDFLCQMEPQQAIDLFCQLKGIGVKTISVVLMFSCGQDVFPVDTHVHRICRRLGLVPNNVSAEKTFWLMQPNVPANKSFSLHMNLLRLGRTICLARKPRCEQCPLTAYCHFYFQSTHQK
ncbi:MAG: endonuclease III [candidate division KSB1 bacterium]|nr:endonuclease III [candidate division KSB1 bacterium]MDZ7319959.1 endonuclease III [candidate division KSB1 bacterium]MDZ7341698.1 endonuclease III [candidate division KSB1 bacterium]